MATTDLRTAKTSAEFDRPVGLVDGAKRALVGFVVLTIALSLLGGIGTLLVFDGAIGNTEADAVGWIAEHRVGVLDSVFTIASTLSDTWTVIGVLVGAVTMLWVAGHVRHALTVALAVILEFTTFLAVGALIGRARPDGETLHSVPSTPSFPSGHVAAAFVLYGSLVLVARSLRSIPRSWWLAPLAIALSVAAARVYEGVHHPTDVAAGLVLGVGALGCAAAATGIAVAGNVFGRAGDARGEVTP